MKRRVFALGIVTCSAGTMLPCATVLASRTKSFEHVVEIRAEGFSPQVVHLRAADRVVWRNSDAVAHTLAARDGSWETEELAPGATTDLIVTYSRAGEYYSRQRPHLTGRLSLS